MFKYSIGCTILSCWRVGFHWFQWKLLAGEMVFNVKTNAPRQERTVKQMKNLKMNMFKVVFLFLISVWAFIGERKCGGGELKWAGTDTRGKNCSNEREYTFLVLWMQNTKGGIASSPTVPKDQQKKKKHIEWSPAAYFSHLHIYIYMYICTQRYVVWICIYVY